MELKDYWRTVRRRWKTVVACTLLVIVAAGVFTWKTTPLYSSSAQIFVATQSSSIGDASAGGAFATQRVTSYADLVKTRKLADVVAKDLGGAIPPDTDVTAAVVPETVNLVITATAPDPVAARNVAQAYAEALRDLVADIETPAGKTTAPIRASIVDDADVSSNPVSPNAPRNLGLGLVLGLLLGLGIAVLRELTDNTISNAETVAEITPLPILGNITSDRGAVEQTPAQAVGSTTPWAEAFRVLRTNMQYVEVDHDRRVFVVSSSLPGEGKSTTAVNLAVTLAMAGQKVALVECDLRRPTMATRLKLDDAVGTTSVLIGKVNLEDAFQEYEDTGLVVLACGQRPPNPSELLQSFAMEKLISELRDRFDVVLLDAPPLLPVTDAALLAARADGMLTVVRHGKTTRDQLRHALERVDSVGAKCVGVVMNMVPQRRKRGGYGYGYGYSYEPLPEKGAKRRKSDDD